MPQIYNGQQSPLEFYAINGNQTLYPGSGRNMITNQTKIGTGKYPFHGPYKNPDITGNANDKYTVGHTNALADNTSPYNGKGTGDGLSQGVYQAKDNYAGGSTEDIFGTTTFTNAGRNKQIIINTTTWGYGPIALGYNNYVHPDTSANAGQVII